jgi:hypothetical protein
MTPRTPQCEVFWALLLSSEHSGVLEDSKSPTFPSVGLHPHTWPKWGCDTHDYNPTTQMWKRFDFTMILRDTIFEYFKFVELTIYVVLGNV